MAVKKNENRDNKQTKKKTTGKAENKVVKERNTVRSGTDSNGSSKKKAEDKVSDGPKSKGPGKKTKGVSKSSKDEGNGGIVEQESTNTNDIRGDVPETKTKTSKVSGKRKSSKKGVESAVPELKEKLSQIVPNAYGLDKFKDWTESMETVPCKQIKVSVKSNAGRHCHNFQIKLYLRELAEKNGVALTDLQLFDDHFEFTLMQPTAEIKTIEV